ncbi:hypothetical protein Tco_1260392 [Tanacetum coccineum]
MHKFTFHHLSVADSLSKLVMMVLISLVLKGDPYLSTSCEVFGVVGAYEDEFVGVGAEFAVVIDAFGF